jgi:serine/threonine protein kinase
MRVSSTPQLLEAASAERSRGAPTQARAKERNEFEKDGDMVRGKQVGGMQWGTGALAKFLLGPWVGQGAFAAVRVARHAEGRWKAAIKVYEKKSESRPSSQAGARDKKKREGRSSAAEIRREARILAQCKHEHIVRFFDFIETEPQAFLVTEYLSGGSLKRWLEKRSPHRCSEPEARGVFRQIATAVAYLHAARICHRDLKLENLLLEKDPGEEGNLKVKVIDFGFAVQMPPGADGTLRTFCGTPPYMSPQMISDQPYCGFTCDVWALGVLLYVMLVGRFPFQGDTRAVLFAAIKKKKYHVPDFLSHSAVAFIRDLLNPSDKERPPTVKLLQDPWLENSPGSTSVGSSGTYGSSLVSRNSRPTSSLRVTREVAAARKANEAARATAAEEQD